MTLKAEGRVYTFGDVIGMTRNTVYDIGGPLENIKKE